MPWVACIKIEISYLIERIVLNRSAVLQDWLLLAMASSCPAPAPASDTRCTAVDDAAMDREFFSFPYEPYSIQLDLMRQLYRTIDSRHVGIFESPTGTGKSMSLICGALTWLVRNTDEFGLPVKATSQNEDTANAVGAKTEEPSWLSSFSERAADREADERRSTAQAALRQIDNIKRDPELQTKKRKMGFAYNHHEHKRARHGATRPRPTAARAAGQEAGEGADEDDEKHIVGAYDSGTDATSALDNDSGDDGGSSKSTWGRIPEKPRYGVTKIIYCSRTHSQISQFVREIQKTAFGDRIRVVSLGSRKNLCINESVTSLRSDVRMTDRCLDMLQGSTRKKDTSKIAKTAKCPFYERDLLGHYKDYAMAQVHDIEDLHKLGKEMSICSYYGSRESIPLAQVVAMPYSMLLSKDARESLGIELEDNIVVLDEAHNIVEAINSTYQVVVSNKQFVVARRSLWAYYKKYEKRLKGKNVFYIKQILSILESLTKFLRQKRLSTASGVVSTQSDDNDESSESTMLVTSDFVFNAGIDNYNMFKIDQYLEQSELPKKLMGFMDANSSQNTPSQATETTIDAQDDDLFESRHVSPLRHIQAFFKSLTNTSADGRIFVRLHNPSMSQEGEIKFVLLNPAKHFEEVVKKARTIILAGGTMKPVSQVIDQLFSSTPRSRIDLFSCGHVIPPENLIGFSLSTGPSMKHLEFTFSNRNDVDAIDELGRILLNLVRVVPNGVVVFFPSYRFEETVVRRWIETSQFDKINSKKTIFREPKHADQLGAVLASYSEACNGASVASGAVLLSVVGGKMSEGINFSDELARCVVMVGLPYPNARDPELLEKMAFMEKRQPGSGRVFYDSLCMKAVNQSIGRSIRHQKDYSSIVLIDHRYSGSHIRSQLPQWIQERVQSPALSFGQVYSQLVQFFKSKEPTKS